MLFALAFLLPLVSTTKHHIYDPTDIPEYSEYKLRLALAKRANTPSQQQQQQQPFLQAPLPFPSIQLCKERPADGDYYGHIVCWTMVSFIYYYF